MSVTVELPAAYRRHADGQRQVAIAAESCVRDGLHALCARFAGLKPQLLTSNGSVYGSVAVFVNGIDVRRLAGMDTRLQAGDVLTLVPAISGG